MADYNINAITRRVVFTGSAGLGPYAFSFEILDQDDLAVYFNATSLTITTDYTVTINANGTGSVNIVTGGSVPSTPTASDQIVIVGARDIERVTDFVTAGDLLASSLNEQLDALTIFDQQVAEENKRGLRAPVYDPALVEDGGVVDMTLPAKADRAGRFLAFDGNGNPTATTNVGDFKGDWAASTVYRIGDLVRDTTDDSIYRVNTDHTSSGSLPLNTNTNAAYYDLFVDLSDINASEAAAAASAAAAAADAVLTAADVVSTNADVVSTNANVALTAADVVTTNNNVTAAQAAQAAAEAALDTFDDRFLGAKASDPALDNDGNALQDGAIYYDTTNEIMKVYDLTNTIWRNLALTGTDQTNVNLVAGQISPTNNIATVAGISADITTTATNNANITTVATSIADVNAVGTDIANVNTVATNLTDINAFADTYFISATAPASPTLGDLWFDTTNDIMKVYSASGFVNAGSSVNGTANRYVYTATSGQTTFAATYDAGYIDVYLNGVKLQSGTDFTATDGANVILTVGASLNDQIDIVGYGTFNIAIPDISGDATPELGGNLATSGNDINFGDNDKAIFGAGSDLQIYHDGSHSYVSDAGTGNLLLLGNDMRLANADWTKNYLKGVNGGTTAIYYDNAEKLATTATGVDVTGTVTADGLTVDTNTLYVDSTNNRVGVGTASPSAHLQVNGSLGNNTAILTDRNGTVAVTVDQYGTTTFANQVIASNLATNSSGTDMTFSQGASEAIRISSGNLLVGRTSVGGTGNGHSIRGGDSAIFSRDAVGETVQIGRNSSNGQLVRFNSNGAEVGSISYDGGNIQYGGTAYVSIRPNSGTSATSNIIWGQGNIKPWNDNYFDIGDGAYRWDDIYATNGTIQTSDQNEKQQIAALTDAEITAAKAISALFKTFKWNDAVSEKGDAARTHAGVIAQDVEAAMTAAGLVAGDYAFFISTTWWETQTEVPAVEAVEAVDAVYEDVVIAAVEEELDEDGNVIVEAQAERTEQRLVSEAIEAVEAVAAYTRTDTYETAEEAPEGATERTRLGVRYPELMAFVGAATEQRLANIETRLTALENV